MQHLHKRHPSLSHPEKQRVSARMRECKIRAPLKPTTRMVVPEGPVYMEALVPVPVQCPEEVAHTSRNVTNLLLFSTPEGSRCRLIPVLSGLQECNYVTLQYKQVMTHAQPPLSSACYSQGGSGRGRRLCQGWQPLEKSCRPLEDPKRVRGRLRTYQKTFRRNN